MSCLRKDEAFSICSSSANASNSAGVLRLSSWRFIGFRVVVGAESPVFGGLAGTESGRREGWRLAGRCEEKPTGGMTGPLPTPDTEVKHELQGVGFTGAV